MAEKFATHTSPEGISLTLWKFRSFHVGLVVKGIAKAVSADLNEDDDDGSFGWFATVFSHLHAMSFALTDDAPEWAVDLKEWWETSGKAAFEGRNYALVWSEFSNLEQMGVSLLLIEAFGATRRDVLKAVPEVSPGAKERGESDEDFLPDGATS